MRGRPTDSFRPAGAHAAAELRERLLERRHVELYAARLPAGPLLTPRLPYACINAVSLRAEIQPLRRRLLPRLLRKSDLGCSFKVALREIGACVWGAVLRVGTT